VLTHLESPQKSFTTEYDRIQVKWLIVEPWQLWRENGIKDCAISTNGGKSLYEFYCAVLGIVATIDSLDAAVRKWSN